MTRPLIPTAIAPASVADRIRAGVMFPVASAIDPRTGCQRNDIQSHWRAETRFNGEPTRQHEFHCHADADEAEARARAITIWSWARSTPRTSLFLIKLADATAYVDPQLTREKVA